MKAITTVFLGAFLAVTTAAIAADAAPDPVVGTWTLNVAKSKFTQGPALKSETRTYEESQDGMVTVTLRSVSADGKESALMRTFKQDGKDYPIHDSSGSDSISETRITDRTAKYTEKKTGRAILRGRRVLAKDGKTLRVTEIGTDPTGAKIKYTLIYDREEHVSVKRTGAQYAIVFWYSGDWNSDWNTYPYMHHYACQQRHGDAAMSLETCQRFVGGPGKTVAVLVDQVEDASDGGGCGYWLHAVACVVNPAPKTEKASGH